MEEKDSAIAFPILTAFGSRPGETRPIGTVAIRLDSIDHVEEPSEKLRLAQKNPVNEDFPTAALVLT